MRRQDRTGDGEAGRWDENEGKTEIVNKRRVDMMSIRQDRRSLVPRLTKGPKGASGEQSEREKEEKQTGELQTGFPRRETSRLVKRWGVGSRVAHGSRAHGSVVGLGRDMGFQCMHS